MTVPMVDATATAAPTRPRRRGRLGSAIADVGAVLGGAVRLLLRHWPTLFALYFAGYAARELILWGAVRASDVNGILGFAIMVLAPITTLSAMVLMLRTVRSSLSWSDATTAVPDRTIADQTATVDPADAEARPRGLLDHLGSVLVPFLAVYASYGYLTQDASQYVYRVVVDETLNNADAFTGAAIDVDSRTLGTVGPALIAAVAVAIVLRWLLGRWQGPRRRPWLGLLGAYLEVIWILVTAVAVQQTQETATGWVQDRQVFTWVTGIWQAMLREIGPLAAPTRTVGAWLAEALASADTVLVVPVAWLTVGAVVYGRSLSPPAAGLSPVGRRLVRAWVAVPRPLRTVGSGVSADLRDRFGPMVNSLRLLARAGLAPMLLFCLAFVVAQTITGWLWEMERWLIGPQELDSVWRPLSGPLSLLNDAIGMVLLVCLLAAAVDRVLRAQPAPPIAPDSETTSAASISSRSPAADR